MRGHCRRSRQDNHLIDNLAYLIMLFMPDSTGYQQQARVPLRVERYPLRGVW